MPQEKQKDDYINQILIENYSNVCLSMCINDYSVPLQQTEKICMAKCIDRAYDYLWMTHNKVCPNPSNISTLFTKLDGNNMIKMVSRS